MFGLICENSEKLFVFILQRLDLRYILSVSQQDVFFYTTPNYILRFTHSVYLHFFVLGTFQTENCMFRILKLYLPHHISSFYRYYLCIRSYSMPITPPKKNNFKVIFIPANVRLFTSHFFILRWNVEFHFSHTSDSRDMNSICISHKFALSLFNVLYFGFFCYFSQSLMSLLRSKLFRKMKKM